MPRLQRLMLATDFSSQADAALEYAAELSARLGAPLLIATAHQVHTLGVPMLEGALIPTPMALAEDLADVSRALEDNKRAAEELGAIGVETELVEGDTTVQLLALVRARDIDLVVMGTHGRGGLSRLVSGSVADTLIRTAPCPVLVVHPTSDQPA